MKLVAEDARQYLRNDQLKIFAVLFLFLKSRGFQVVCMYRLSSWLRRHNLSFISKIMDWLQALIYGSEINSAAMIGPGFTVAHTSGLVIGGKVRAGKNLSIRHCTTLGGNSGKCRADDMSWTQPRLGDNVTIGCNSVVLGPVLIGDNVVIGACSLVLSDLASNGVYCGQPAKRLRG